MIIQTKDGVEVEVTHCDAGYAPGSKPNKLLNTTAVWFKPLGGEWMRTSERSAMKVAERIRHTDSDNLRSISDHISNQIEVVPDEQEVKEPIGS
jgi:hypothetical protein